MKLGILGSRGFPSTYGGYETLVRHLAPYLVAEGHDVTVYCRAREHGRRVWATSGVRCVATRGWDSKSLSTLSYGASATVHAVRQKFDALLVLNVANGYYLPALTAASIPTAVNTDGLEWERGKWGTVGKAVFRAGASMTARYATALIADSTAIATRWHTMFGVQSAFIPYGAPVLNAVPTDHIDALGLRPQTYVLVVARLIPENNVDLALDATHAVCTPDCPLVVVGSANSTSMLEARLVKATRTGAVRWLGHVSDQELLTQLWSHCGVYVHGHSVGGTNPGLLQALGAGAPTLALDTVYNREVLPRGDQLFPLDASVLAMRVDELLRDARRQRTFRDRGQAIVAEQYRWEAVCGAYLDVLQRLANGVRTKR